MTPEEKTAAAKALREEQRNGRIAKDSRDGQDPGANGGSDGKPGGTAFQDAGRAVSAASRTRSGIEGQQRSNPSDRRGIESQPGRSGLDNRRSDQNGGGALDVPEKSGSGVGRLIPDGPQLERKLEPNKPNATFETSEQPVRSEDKNTNLRSKYPQANKIILEQPQITVRKLADELGVAVSTAHDIKLAWEEVRPAPKIEKPAEPGVLDALKMNVSSLLPRTGVLSNQEAEQLKETLPAALEDDFRYLDEYLWSRQAHADKNFSDLDKKPIWSNLDDDEIEALTKIMLKAGKRSPAAAAVVRATVESRDYIVTAAIVAPRVRKTFVIVRATHQAPVSRLIGGKREDQH